MSQPAPPHPLPNGFRSWAEYNEYQQQEFAKPYARPITYDARYWSRKDSKLGTHWEVWAWDANRRLVGSESSRFKWRAIQKIKHHIDEHEGRRRSRRYRFEEGIIE
jgi:hypothetical protein